MNGTFSNTKIGEKSMQKKNKKIVAIIWEKAQKRYGLGDSDYGRARQKIMSSLRKRYFQMSANSKEKIRINYDSAPKEAEFLLDFDDDLAKYFEQIASESKETNDKTPLTDEEIAFDFALEGDRVYREDLKYPKFRALFSKEELNKLISKDDLKDLVQQGPDMENIFLKKKLEAFDTFFDKEYRKPKDMTIYKNYEEVKRVIIKFISYAKGKDIDLPLYRFDDVVRCVKRSLDFDWAVALEKFQRKIIPSSPKKNSGLIKFDWNNYLKDAIKYYFFVDYDRERPTDLEYYRKINHPENYFKFIK